MLNIDVSKLKLSLSYRRLNIHQKINTRIMATYRGKRVTLNKVRRGGSKKVFVYVKSGNKVKKVSFGSSMLSVRKTKQLERAF